MHIQTESPAETDTRLRRVLRDAELEALPGLWHFAEFPHTAFTSSLHPEALALTRDGDTWSQLIPVFAPTAAEPLAVLSIHFQTGIDNSGFVGWLATLIKQHTGSGVAVICGQNTARGGIFDLWCAPAPAAPAINNLLAHLRTDHSL